jgi:two-component system, OmpR family, response regulator
MRKILLVEDDPLLIDIYKTKFKSAGFEVEVIEKGDQVVEAVTASKPDVVLLDIVLPHMDGWDVLESLKQHEQTKHIPVFVLSNLGQREEIEKGIKLGAAKYLIKAHYTPSEVLEEIQKIVPQD